jgi:hypothetical protein
MRIMILIAPAFLTWPLAIARRLKALDPSIELIGVASTTQIYDKVKAVKDIQWARLDCLENITRDILAAPYNPAELIHYEKMLGIDTVNNILINDRQVGRAFISTGATPVETELTHKTQSDESIRAYITGFLKFADDMCRTNRPDVAFYYALSSGPALALAEIIKHNGGHVFRIEHTRVDNRHLVDYSIHGQLAPVWKRYENGEQGSPALLADAKTWLETYRHDLMSQPDYMQYFRTMINKSYSPAGIVKGIIKSAARFFLYEVVKGKKSLYTDTGWQRLKNSFILPFKYHRFYKMDKFKTLEELGDTPFIYFPLHLDPESATMHLAPDHLNQLTVIEALAKRKPLHMNLIVKEHPVMFGHRPKEFYKRLQEFPGVYMVHPAMPSRLLIQRSAMIATITGTVAWEAILAKKPALVFGFSPFRNFPKGIVYNPDLSTLGQGIEKTLALEPLPDAEAIRFLSLIFEESFPMQTNDIWGNPNSDIETKFPEVLNNVVEQIMRRYKEVKADTSVRSTRAAT